MTIDADGAGSEEAAQRATAKPAADRLTFFSDAVVAIAITLLAIELPAPVGASGAEVLASVSEHGYEYVTFLISFSVIGSHWGVHHRVFRYVARADGPLVRLDLLWLLLVVIQPFMTRVINEGELDLLRFGAYAAVQALQLSVMALMILVISRRGWFEPAAPTSLTHRGYTHSLTVAAGFLVSIPAYLLIGAWAFALWALVPMVAGRIADRRGRR